MSQSKLYMRKTNVTYLVHGYSRKSVGKLSNGKYLPPSALDVIKHYYPKMNGSSFVWKITNYNVIQQLLDSNDEKQTLDSDVFDIGLPNKFYLQIARRSNINTNNASSSSSSSSATVPIISFRGQQAQKNKYSKYSNNENRNIVLNIMGFPLPNFEKVIFHCELYLYQIKAEYSAIWSVPANDPNTTRRTRAYGDYENNENNKYIKFEWPINYDFTKYDMNEMTFECKINILKIEPAGYQNYVRNYSINSTGRRQRDYFQQQQEDAYSYESSYDHGNQLNRKLKFYWNICNNNAFIHNLCSEYLVNPQTAPIQIHSDIFFDIFQLKILNQNYTNQFIICSVGLPKYTHKMGVKMEIFAINDSQNTNDNKISVLSSIMTFSYNSPTFELSRNQCDLLIGLLSKHKKLSLVCHAQIIQKYDQWNECVSDGKIQVTKPKNDEKRGKQNGTKQRKTNSVDTAEIQRLIKLSQQKVMKLCSDSFVWHITRDSDDGLIDKIKSTIKNVKNKSFDSKIFKVLGHKWFIRIDVRSTVGDEYGGMHPPNFRNQAAVYINIHCVSNKTIHCKLCYQLIQTGNICENTQILHSDWDRDSYYYGPPRRGYPNMMENHEVFLALKEITIKVDIAIIAEYAHDIMRKRYPLQSNYYVDDEDNKESVDILIQEEVKNWLSDTVGLPQYLHLFEKNAIDDLKTVKLLNMEYLDILGIQKLGHKLKILKQIDMLKQLKN